MTTVKERPIIFTGEMVRAILAGKNPLVYVVEFKVLEVRNDRP